VLRVEEMAMETDDKEKRELYLKQVKLLKKFLATGAISQAQYDKSFTCMTEKMGMEGIDLTTLEEK